MADVAGNLSLEIAGDWMIELFFPRDIVQTIDLQKEKP